MRDHPHWIWPTAIVALLLLSAATTFAILMASRSDGGAQVVDNYYRKSVAWDSVAASRRASDNLSWQVHVDILSSDSAGSTGLLTFTDANGSAIQGLSGSVSVSRPQSAVVFGTHSLAARDTTRGMYSFSFPYQDHGLWDLDVVASRGGQRFMDRIRIEN